MPAKMNLWKTLMFTCMQKINFISNFFLKVFQRCWKLTWVIWACLDKPIQKSTDVYQKKNQLIENDIEKILHTCYFDYLDIQNFRHVRLCPSYMIVSAYRNLWCLSAQKIIFILNFFLEILQRFCKFVMLGTLDMAIHAHQKW